MGRLGDAHPAGHLDQIGPAVLRRDPRLDYGPCDEQPARIGMGGMGGGRLAARGGDPVADDLQGGTERRQPASWPTQARW